MPNVGDGDSALSKGLENIEKIYDECLQSLYQVRHTILNPSDSSWNNNYQKFRLGVNETENLVEQVLNDAFETVTSVKEGVEILDVFYQYTPRQRIRQVYEGKIERVYRKFNTQLQQVRRKLSNNKQLGILDQPRFSGKNIWLNNLQTKINSTINILQSASWFSVYGIMNVSKAEYRGVMEIITRQISEVNKQWNKSLDKNSSKKLESYLLNANLHTQGTMDINFDRNLIKLVKEVEIWTTYNFSIPSHVKGIYNKIGPTVCFLKTITKVVKDYNQIMTSLSADEKGLFMERIRRVDRFIWMGKNQHTWDNPDLKEWLIAVNESMNNTFDAIVNYKNINGSVQTLCREIEELEMIDITSKGIVSGESFKSHQMAHINKIQKEVSIKYEQIKASVSKLKESFTKTGTNVEVQWKKYEHKIDERVAKAIRNGILSSLLGLAEAISSSGKTGLTPMMKITIKLKDSQVHVSPKLSTILDIFKSTQATLVNVARNIGQNNGAWQMMITEVVENNPEFQEVQENIFDAIRSTTGQIEEYIKTWDVYKDTWELDPEKLKKLYMETSPETGAFDADVAKYKYLAKNCKKHEAVVWIGFILVDCFPLQEGVIQQCEQWQNIFIEMMCQMVHNDLEELYSFVQSSNASLECMPENVYDLKVSMGYHSAIHQQISCEERKFDHIKKLTDVIKKYKRELDSEDARRLKGLNAIWSNFITFVSNSGSNLQAFREKSREELMSRSHDFERHVKTIVEEYTLSGPFGVSWKIVEAFKQLDFLNEKIVLLSASDKEISDGLAIFNFHRPVNQDLVELDGKLKMLSLLWQLAEAWEDVHMQWQVSKIIDVDLERMKESIDAMNDRIKQFNETDIDNRWEIFFQVKNQIQSYEKIKHLITVLVKDSLRSRHWEDIFIIIRDIQPNADEIKIEKESLRIQDLTNLGFDKCINSIEDVLHSAKREIEIEDALQELSNLVRESKIITDVNKQDFCIIKNISELCQLYKDAHENLRELKLSRFIAPFSILVEELGKDISIILMLLEKLECSEKTVLEVKEIFSMFCMKKQLPRQTRILSDTLEFWTDVISQIHTDPRIYKFTEQKTLTAGLDDMITSLHDIRKQLGSFLLFRKQQYHRLFILTDEELLKFLASKSCDDISPYIQKLYPNVSKVVGASKRDGSILVQKILTNDGEVIQYQCNAREKETMENIASGIGELLSNHVKTQILSCLQAMKKNLKLEQILRDFSFQSYEVARRIFITTELTKLFESTSGKEQNSKLVEITKSMEENMEKISRLKQSATAQKQKLKLLNINNVEFSIKICIVRMQRYQYFNDTENCQTLPEWFAFFKFYYAKARHEIVINHGYQTYTYGYESLKMEDPLINFPSFNDIFLDFSCIAKARKCAFINGTIGDGKSSAVQALSNILGKYLFKCQVDSSIKKPHVGQFIKILKKGNYMVHILMWNFCEQQMSALSNEVVLLKCEELENLSLFLTLHMKQFTEVNITGDIRKSFRAISYTEENLPRLTDAKLAVEGFNNFELLRARTMILVRGFTGIYYDTGFRICKSIIFQVLNNAVSLMREDKNMLQEESILQSFWQCFEKTSRYELAFPMHKAVKDLFPRLEIKMMEKQKDDHVLLKIVETLRECDFPEKEELLLKMYEVWRKLNSSNCVMVVGKSNTLKSFIINAITRILEYAEKDVLKLSLHKEVVENLVSGTENSSEVLSDEIGLNSITSRGSKLIYFDGIMSNSTTLLLNELTKKSFPICYDSDSRISLGDNVKIVLETQYVSKEDLGRIHNASIVMIEKNYLDSFEMLETKLMKVWKKDSYFDTFVQNSKMLLEEFVEFSTLNCTPQIDCDLYTIETNFISLFEGLVKIIFDADTRWKTNEKCIKKMALFCSLWAVFPTITSKDQVKVDDHIRLKGSDVPVYGTVFDFYIDKENLGWEHWKKNIKEWNYSLDTPHSAIYIQTVQYIKCEYFLNLLLQQGKNVLLTGPKGSGKSSIVGEFLKHFDKSTYHIIPIQVCHNTPPKLIFESIIRFTQKKSKNEVQPIGGKKILLYLDDTKLDDETELGDALKFFWENKSWLVNGEVLQISDVIILATETMDYSSRPRYVTSARKSFQFINLDEKSENDIISTYQTILKGKFMDFEVNIKFLTLSIIKGTIGTYNDIKELFKDRADIFTNFHLHDIKKVICGVLRSDKDCHDTKFEVVQLWVNEVLRTFRDRMRTEEYESEVVDIVRLQTKKVFNLDFDTICENEETNEPPMFGNILDTYGFYTDLDDDELLDHLSKKALEYDQDNPKLNLIFNDYIVQNIVKILRVISEPEGHIILSGESGRCRQSMIRLSAYIYKMKIVILGEKDVTEQSVWRKTLRTIIRIAGIEDTSTLLYVAIGEIDCSLFLRTLSTMLSFGIDSTLFGNQEISAIEKRKKTEDEKSNLRFMQMCKNVLKNLHVVFSLDLGNHKISSYFSQFYFLLSKVVINHINPLKIDDFQQIGSIVLASDSDQESLKLPESISNTLSLIYIKSESKVKECLKRTVLSPASFHSFLTHFLDLGKMKTNDRRLLHQKHIQVFENVVLLEKYAEDLYAKVSTAKEVLNDAQKIYDELQVQKMQLKRDYDDVQKKLSDEQKRLHEEKTNISLLETSLKGELEELWSPVERSKIQLQELTSADIIDLFEKNYPDSKLVFVRAISILFSEDQELTENGFIKLISFMVNVTNESLTDAMLIPFLEFVAKNKPKQEIIHTVDDDFILESIKLWCISVEAFGKGRKSSNQKRQKCEQLKKKFDIRQDSITEVKQQALSLDFDMDVIEENSSAQMNIIEEGIKTIEGIESKIEKSERVKTFLELDLKSFQVQHSRFDEDILKIIGDSILSTAAVSFYPPLNTFQRREIFMDWKSILNSSNIRFSESLDYVTFLHGKDAQNQFLNKNLASSRILLENYFILKSMTRNNIIICVDPDDIALPILSASEGDSSTIVAHVDDKHLRKNVVHTLARGETLIVRNAEDRYEKLVLPIKRRVFKKENDTDYIKIFGSLCHFNEKFKLRILISDFKFVTTGSNIVVLNFSNCEEDYESLFFSMISSKKSSSILNQKNEMFSLQASAEETVDQAKQKLLRTLSMPLDKLLKDKKTIENVNKLEDTISSFTEKLLSYETNYKIALENLMVFKPLARYCAKLFIDLLSLKYINQIYCITLQYFCNLVDVKEEDDDDDDTESELTASYGLLELSPDEHCILLNILKKLEEMMTTKHFSVALLKLGTSVALFKNHVTSKELSIFNDYFTKLSKNSFDLEESFTVLQQFLSQAESKVIHAVMETSQTKYLLEELTQIRELSLLKLICTVSVYVPNKLQECIEKTFAQILDVKISGIIKLLPYFIDLL